MATPNLNYFNPNALQKFDEKYKISMLSSIKESEVELLINAGFLYNVENNHFKTNVMITNTLYNVIITYMDSNFRMYAKLSTTSNYSDSTNKFSVSAKKTLIASSTNTTAAKYEYSIEYMLFKFESWIEKTEYAAFRTALTNKIGNRTFDIEYQKDDMIINKISNNRFFVKLTDEKSEAYDITSNLLSKEDLLNIDKLIVIKINEIAEKENTKMSFQEFSSAEKNTIQ